MPVHHSVSQPGWHLRLKGGASAARQGQGADRRRTCRCRRSGQAGCIESHPLAAGYGDFIEQDSRWPKIRATGLAFADGIRAAGGSTDVVDLPKVGITGSSHMMMMDKNNTEVAALIQAWLESKRLTKKP